MGHCLQLLLLFCVPPRAQLELHSPSESGPFAPLHKEVGHVYQWGNPVPCTPKPSLWVDKVGCPEPQFLPDSPGCLECRQLVQSRLRPQSSRGLITGTQEYGVQAFRTSKQNLLLQGTALGFALGELVTKSPGRVAPSGGVHAHRYSRDVLKKKKLHLFVYCGGGDICVTVPVWESEGDFWEWVLGRQVCPGD